MQTLPMELPKCDKPGHGYMALRPEEWQTPEQLWCGVWYDCQHCAGGVLSPSRELLAQNARLAPLTTKFSGRRRRSAGMQSYAALPQEDEMGQYRKKSVVVEAVQWFKHGDHPAVKRRPEPYMQDCPGVCDIGEIETLEGPHLVRSGDWIITGVKGEHYPCKPDIFEATYDAV